MQMSDTVQNSRRVRLLYNSNDLKMLLAQDAAREANIDLANPDVQIISVDIVVAPMPGCSAAEVILLVGGPR